MNTKEEKLLIGIAFKLKNQLQMLPLSNHQPRDFRSFGHGFNMVYGDALRSLLPKMSSARLGIVIGVQTWKEKYIEFQFLQTQPSEVSLEKDTRGRIKLTTLAEPVIIAAIYDILIAEGFLAEKASLLYTNTAECSQTMPWPHAPKPAMRKFLEEQAMLAN